MAVTPLARLAADAVLGAFEPYRRPGNSGETQESPEGLDSAGLDVLVRHASTSALAGWGWPAARDELLGRISSVTPEDPMPPEDVHAVRDYFRELDVMAEDTKSLIARTVGIALVKAEYQNHIVSDGIMGFAGTNLDEIDYRALDYLMKNPDRMPEEEVEPVVQQLSHDRWRYLQCMCFALTNGPHV